MTRCLRSFVPASGFLLLVFALSLTGRAAPSQDRATATRITAATNVTLRAQPSPTAPAVAQIPLGTEVTDAGPVGLDKTWVRVKLGDGREGWLLANLTKPLDTAWRWPTFDRIITERLGRKGDGFPALAELVAFIERVAPEYTDPDGRARVELSRLRATAAALAAIPADGARRDPYAPWLAARKTDVIYDEPGGRWLLSSAAIWDLHARHAKTMSADDIAWFAVTNGLGGECEGYLPCYVEWRNRLQGEYLRRQPGGRHVDEAVGVVKDTADLLTAPPKPHEAYQFDRAKDCRDLTASLDALAAAVKGSRAANRDAALASLATLRKTCGDRRPGV
jgi:hypothetical protein